MAPLTEQTPKQTTGSAIHRVLFRAVAAYRWLKKLA
jgi:hypothetical protein